MKSLYKAIQDQFRDKKPLCAPTADEWAARREEMVEIQIRRRGVADSDVLEALRCVPRHHFVVEENRLDAYEDKPLPIGVGQTISQPYIVAAMTAALALRGHERVLEIGTGCGYQAAILSHLAKEVFSVERHAELAKAASKLLSDLGYENVRVHCGDGTFGFEKFAPFDAILVAAAAPALPPPLVAQLAEGGRLIIPIGGAEHQQLKLFRRHGEATTCTPLEACRFLPLIGYYGVQETCER